MRNKVKHVDGIFWKNKGVAQCMFSVWRWGKKSRVKVDWIPGPLYGLLLDCNIAGLKLAWRDYDLFVSPSDKVDRYLAARIRAKAPMLLAMRNKAMGVHLKVMAGPLKNANAQPDQISVNVVREFATSQQAVLDAANAELRILQKECKKLPSGS